MESLRELVRRALAAELRSREREDAFGEIVGRFQDLAFGFAYSLLGDVHLAEDATQEAFVTAWSELEKLQQPDAFPGWLRRIVASRCNRLTRRARLPAVPLEDALHLPGSTPDPHEVVERGQANAHVRQAVAALPEAERVATTLFYVNEYSQKEIAAFLEVPVTTVQKRLFTARKRLRGLLQDTNQERTLAMVQSNLQENRPSRDDRLVRVVRLFNAVALGDAETVSQLLAGDSELVRAESRGQWGDRTPLHVAAEKGHADIVKTLLRHGADVHARDHGDNATPLHWAAGENHLETAELLLDHGADPNAVDDMHERGPLGWAVALGECHPEMAELLIGRGARPDIFAAVALERADEVRALAAADSGVLSARMSVCEDFQHPLHFAVSKERPEMLALLLDLGADVSARTPSGRTPLCVAIEQKKQALVDLLLSRGAEVDLLSAIALGRAERVDELLAQAVDPVFLSQALLAAAHHGRTEMVERLLELGADINARGHADWLRASTPLILAANGNHTEAARTLVEHGADVAVRNEYPGATALHFAAWHGNRALAELLLARGADLSVKDGLYDGDSLGWAAENGQAEMIDFLLERGAHLDLSRAAYFGRIDLVRSMLDADPAQIDAPGNYGTALHQAALHGFPEIVALLLERGADTAVPNRHGDSVLTMVRKARQGLARPSKLEAHPVIEEMLVRHGAAE